MISDSTAAALRESAIAFNEADNVLRGGAAPALAATRYVQVRREHQRNIEQAEREEQSLDEGQ